jgi:hypothetical protein
MLCSREYRSEYIPDRVCDVFRVGRCSVLNKCPVALFGGSVMSVHFGTKSLNHGQEQNKDEQNLCYPNWS